MTTHPHTVRLTQDCLLSIQVVKDPFEIITSPINFYTSMSLFLEFHTTLTTVILLRWRVGPFTSSFLIVLDTRSSQPRELSLSLETGSPYLSTRTVGPFTWPSIYGLKWEERRIQDDPNGNRFGLVFDLSSSPIEGTSLTGGTVFTFSFSIAYPVAPVFHAQVSPLLLYSP